MASQTQFEKNQEKRADRRKQTAEDFTPTFLVDQILDKLETYAPESFSDPKKTFIDPACGNGNFLVRVVERKMATGIKPLDVAKTVFGLDIMKDNINEARFRVLSVFERFSLLKDDKESTDIILEIWKNIRVTKDTLALDFDKTIFKLPENDTNVILKIKQKVKTMVDSYSSHATRTLIKKYFYSGEHLKAIQNVHTPFDLAEAVCGRLGVYTGFNAGKRWATMNLEFVDVLLKKGVKPSEITFISEWPSKISFARDVMKVNVILDDFVTMKDCGKFDVVVGNPPYQGTEKNTGGGNSLWDKFVDKTFNSMVIEGGFVSLIHPSSWRAPRGSFVNIKNTLYSKSMYYLELHNTADGQKTFNSSTRYDWYIVKNENRDESTIPIIKDEDGIENTMNIYNLPFIPNSNFNKINSLLSVGQNKCNVFHKYSYQQVKTSKDKTSTHTIPVVFKIKKGEGIIDWSDTNTGAYGVPKVIFYTRGNTIVDSKGEYDVGHTAGAIIDDVENLENINKALHNEKLLNLIMKDCVSSGGAFESKYIRDTLATFRKDFWKEFV